MEKQIEAHQSSADRAGGGSEGVTRSKVRNVAFKGLVILFSLLLLAVFNITLVLIIVSWLPDATYMAVGGEGANDLVHRLHDGILSVISWSMFIGIVVQLRRPEARVAPLLMVLAIAVINTFVEFAMGRMTVAEAVPFLAPIILIAVLHPRARELVRIPGLHGLMAGLTAAAAAVWIPFAYGQAQLQLLAAPGDVHAELGHWSRMAIFALAVIVLALIAATDHRGWRLTAWIAGLASAWYGFQSLLFPVASAASVPWALAAIAWGVAFLVAAERRARAAQSEEHSAMAAQPG